MGPLLLNNTGISTFRRMVIDFYLCNNGSILTIITKRFLKVK